LSAQRRLFFSVLALIGVFVVGTGGYVLLEDGIGLGDAAYMTIITISSVGYGEAWKLDSIGKVWTALVIVFGIGTASLAFSSLLTLLVSGEVRTVRGRLRMQAKIDAMTNHVIVCGYGRTGSLAADDLVRKSIPVAVVESDPAVIPQIEEAGLSFLAGDATEDETLYKAGLMRARVLIATLATDADNVYVTLTARGLRPDLRIIARAEHPGTEVKLRRAGANNVVCPQIVGAARIANLVARPHVVEFIEVAAEGVGLEVSEHTISAVSSFKGKSLRESDFRRRAGGMVVAIKRADGTMVFSPAPDDFIHEADTLIVIGTAGVAERLEAMSV